MYTRKIILALWFVAAGLTGCTKKDKITGKEYVPRETMVNVLVDIHLVDGITNDRRFYRRYDFNDSIDMISPIFEKYNITSAEFDSTLAEYSRHPMLFDKLYNDVLMRLNVMLDELDNAPPEDGISD